MRKRVHTVLYLFRPLIMKAFPECWVSNFFITLYSSWFSCNQLQHKHTTQLAKYHLKRQLEWSFKNNFFFNFRRLVWGNKRCHILPSSFPYRRHLSGLICFGTPSRSNLSGYKQEDRSQFIFRFTYSRVDHKWSLATLSHTHSRKTSALRPFPSVNIFTGLKGRFTHATVYLFYLFILKFLVRNNITGPVNNVFE